MDKYFINHSHFGQDLNLQIGMDEECTNMLLCEYEIEKDDIEKQYEIVEPEKKKRDKASTSECWRYFTRLGRVRMEKKGQGAIVATNIKCSLLFTRIKFNCSRRIKGVW